jgi:osmotically-inducible protein OsmY
MGKRYEDRYGRGGYRRDRDRSDDRGHMDRAADEVRSWFGDDDAERRREMDERYDRSDWNSDRDRRSWSRPEGREWTPSRYEQRSHWQRPENWRGSSPSRQRYEDWARTWSSSNYGRDRGLAQYGQSQYGDARSFERSRTADRGNYMNRDLDRDRDRYRGSEDRDDRDWDREERTWDRDRNPDYDYRASRTGAAGWSTDDGRMQFGTERWGRGPKGYQRSDNRIHEDVCDRLAYSDVDAENIEVTVSSGEVTLAGSVRDRWDKRRAEDLVEDIAGVRDVHNNIRVSRPDRGIGQSETSASDQPGTVLGINPTEGANIASNTPGSSGPAGNTTDLSSPRSRR